MINQHFLFLLLLFCFWQTVSSDFATTKEINAREVRNCAERGTPGLICSSCTRLSKCVQKAGGRWSTIDVETCVGPNLCNLKEGGCSTKPGPCTNRRKEITCNTEGLVPDPLDCQKYHFCENVGEYSIAMKCKGNLSFNLVTGKCDKDIKNSAACKRIPLKCEKAGFSQAWPEDKNLFYVCVKQGPNLIAEFHRCENGHEYVNDSLGCVKKGQGGSSPGGSVPEICTELGKYPDPKDEDSFYHCTKIGQKPRHKSCDWGETFDPKKLKCVCDSWWCW